MIRLPALAALLVLAAGCGERAAPSAEQAAGEPAAAAAEPGDFADLVIRGGTIHTNAENGPATVGAVAVKDGLIVGRGDAAALAAMAGPETQIIDLGGAAMFPGFVDAHAHLLGIGMRELTLNLEGVGSIAELVAIVAAETAGGDALVYGRGWIETGWPEGRMPTRDDLDPVSGEAIVILERADGHALVANSAALNAAGIDDATPDPQGGRIERDASGRATGVLIDYAMAAVEALAGAPDAAQKRAAYAAGARVYAAYGWTGVHNMSVDPDDLALMEEMSDEGELPIRVYNNIDKSGLDALIAGGLRSSENGRIVTRAMKLYVDGALGSRGAALLEPYSDRPETDGLLLMQEAEARALFDKAVAAGVQVATHAIGDRGNRLVLDWYGDALDGRDPDDMRWRIEHAQIVDPADIDRFARLGVIASMQPSHAIGDLFFAPDRLGPDRLDGAYAWRALIDAGAVIAGGSDAPVERGDPRIEFYAAVARRGLDGTQTDDWRPAQAVTRAEALDFFTKNPAYAAFAEAERGSIEIGKAADFTVFADDLMTAPEDAILTTTPLLTIVDGEIVHRAAAE